MFPIVSAWLQEAMPFWQEQPDLSQSYLRHLLARLRLCDTPGHEAHNTGK